ncbi:MAG TPA: DNA repair protein RecN, partial [Gemmatimonadales bacterium]
TGETGAGKSMLVDALALLLGARADAGAVRPGAARTLVEGAFEPLTPPLRRELDALGLEAGDDRLIIRREVMSEGRSRAWVNGSPATAGGLSQLGRWLVDLHGQYETQTLLQAERQRDVLDAFGDAEPEARAVANAWEAVQQLAKEEATLSARRDEVRRRADYLRHVVQEIDAARLRPGEDESLDLEARRLSQAGTLTDLARRIADAVDGEDGSALSALAQADRALSALERTDPGAAAWRELLDAAFANVQELGKLASDYAEELAEDPARLAELERRRDVIYRLKQKHGETISAILETRRQAGDELDLLDTADLDLKLIADRRKSGAAELERLAGILSEKRRAAAERLARAVNRLLPRLGLPGGRLGVDLAALEQAGSAGAETVQFLIRLNQGMEPRLLARSASGGELSRLMLAIKTALGRHDAVPTLVFDEIDAGVGGEVGGRVGETLAEVAERHQVLVITHLPQIAAAADRHLVVAKRTKGGLATSDVGVIHGEDRVTELARMLGDPDAETARRHAVALLREQGTGSRKPGAGSRRQEG